MVVSPTAHDLLVSRPIALNVVVNLDLKGRGSSGTGGDTHWIEENNDIRSYIGVLTEIW